METQHDRKPQRMFCMSVVYKYGRLYVISHKATQNRYYRVDKYTSATEVFLAHTGAIQIRLLLLFKKWKHTETQYAPTQANYSGFQSSYAVYEMRVKCMYKSVHCAMIARDPLTARIVHGTLQVAGWVSRCYYMGLYGSSHCPWNLMEAYIVASIIQSSITDIHLSLCSI